MGALASLPVPLLTAALAILANSSSQAAEFTWDAPEGCPDRDALRWRIEEALGTTLANAAPLIFSAKVEGKLPKHWVVALDASGSANPTEVQHRELHASSCDELAQAVSVAIALALGADQTERKETLPATPVSEAPEAPEPTRPDATELSRAVTPKKEPESKRSYWGAAELGPTFDLGSLPGLAPGIEIAGLAGKGALGVRLSGLVLPNRTTLDSNNRGGRFTLLAASAMACGLSTRSSVIVRICAGSEFGRLSGTGVNTTTSWTGTSSWVAPRIDLESSWPLFDDSLRLFGAGTLAMPMIRKEFSVSGLGLVHQTDQVIGRLGAGLELLWR